MLRDRVTPSERAELDRAFSAVSQITERQNEEDVARILRQKFAISRWRGMMDAFHNCSDVDPLCVESRRAELANIAAVSIDDTNGNISVATREQLVETLKELASSTAEGPQTKQ